METLHARRRALARNRVEDVCCQPLLLPLPCLSHRTWWLPPNSALEAGRKSIEKQATEQQQSAAARLSAAQTEAQNKLDQLIHPADQLLESLRQRFVVWVTDLPR